MRKNTYLLITLLVLSTFLLAACGGGGQSNQSPQGGATNSGNSGQAPNPPAEYANKTNPHKGDAASADAGKTIFSQNCASCHGESGRGDGPAAASLNPKPADLAVKQGGLSDAYLLWRISEGGQMAPFNSAMPAWKNTLSEDQIWQVITFIRSLK